ncbi:MAG: SPOR domain-containing protein [Xanthomonadales bacterium]|nr:SPOR domain-containing protein [Xanthomonadales bacterium]
MGAASAATEVSGQPQAIPEKQSRLKPLPQSESWILAQNPKHYTIQAIALSDREKLLSLLEGHEYLAPYAIYTVQRSTSPLYVLVQGIYPTVEEARTARDKFPRAINRPSRVWIRQFGKVQQIIEAEE